MIFRQLFDRQTCTYTYLLACESTREAVLIDPVLEHFDRDRTLLHELGVSLVATLETHVHADHVTSASLFADACGAQPMAGGASGVESCAKLLADGEVVRFGTGRLETRFTPGHTEGCVVYVDHQNGRAFTGDALFVRGCGRTDFQGGDAATLYASVHDRVLSLPDETLLYPGHDYRGFTCTSVAEERAHNPRLGAGRSSEDFVRIMDALNLPDPVRMAVAVPANQRCGAPMADAPA